MSKIVNGDFVLLNKEGLDNVLHKANSSHIDLYKTECVVKVRNTATGTTKEYPVYRDGRHRSYFDGWIDGVGLKSIFLDEFTEVE